MRKTRRGRGGSVENSEPQSAHQEQKQDEDEQVINFSAIPLSTSHVSVLSKGLTFAPKNTASEF